jgi:hypothetical protein
MMHDQDEFVETINLWQLRQVQWPLMRVLSPHFIAEVELGRYMKRLLASGRWNVIRVVPHQDGGRPSDHVFDVYGQPASPI